MGKISGKAELMKYKDEAQLEGKIAIVTGASSGIGMETAKLLAMGGCGRVIMAVRNVEKGEKVAEKLRKDVQKQEKKELNLNLEVRKLDLASLASVKAFADGLSDVEKVHILVLNAGQFSQHWQLSEDGYEIGHAVQFGHHLLARLLEDKLIAAAPSRVVVVASNAHGLSAGKKGLDIPKEGEDRKGFLSDSAKGYGTGIKAYSHAKLSNILFARQFAKHMEGKNVAVHALHPGVIASSIWPKFIPKLFFKDLDYGAATSIRCAIDPSLQEMDCEYFAPVSGAVRVSKCTRKSRDMEEAERFWNASEQIIKAYLQ